MLIGNEWPTVLIGERINPTGKKKLAEALQTGNLEIVRQEAIAQVQAGADILDINVGAASVDEVSLLPRAVETAMKAVDVPLCLDSANPKALEAALKLYRGKPLVSSVTGHEPSLKEILPLVKEYGTAVIGLTIDDEGIPNEPEQVKNKEVAMIYADDVLLNCNVITIDPKRPRAEAIAIKDGRFLLVGNKEEIKETIGKQTKVRDLGGMTVVPGFNDAHCHPLLFAVALKDIDLDDASIRSIQDIINVVKTQAKQQETGTWINCLGYDQNRLQKRRHITRWELDKAAPEHFVRLRHFGLHSVVVNSKVLALAGITKDTPDPEGGEIERDPKTGQPTGVMLEMPAIALIDRVMPRASYEDVIENLSITNQRFLAEGITSYAHAGVGLQVDWPRAIGAYQEAVETGALKIRVSLQPWHERFFDYQRIDEELDVLDSKLFKFGIRSGLGDEKLRIGPFKIIMDGGVSLITAATYEPYGADPEHRGTGILTMEPELLTRIVSALHQRGWQMSIHAIGDRTVDVVLNAYEAALRERPRPNHRHHIEHCTIMNVPQMNRMKQLGILCVTQPHFIWDVGDSFFRQLGIKRAEEGTLRFRTMLNNGVFTAFSSDRPCSSGTPLLGIHAAVNRKTKSGQYYGRDETLSVESALRLYTLNGAYTTFEDGIKGSVEAGKLADLAVLTADPTQIDPDGIKDISVAATLVGGEVVYEKS